MSDVVARDYTLDDEVNATEPVQLKALADPLRLQLCDFVLERAMSVTELAERVGRPKGTVAYHVDVLVDAGLLKVVRTRQVRAVRERFYGRVARTIVFPHRDDRGMPFIDDVLREVDADLIGREGVPGITTLRHARIPLERVDEYRRRMAELALEFVDEPRSGDIEFGMYLALYPTTRSPNVGTPDATAPDSREDDR